LGKNGTNSQHKKAQEQEMVNTIHKMRFMTETIKKKLIQHKLKIVTIQPHNKPLALMQPKHFVLTPWWCQ
jgi:hypothetical protein